MNWMRQITMECLANFLCYMTGAWIGPPMLHSYFRVEARIDILSS